MAKRSDRVYDELINFLGDPLFQIPITTFMEQHCEVFTMDIPPEDCAEDHKIIHENYKKVVDVLLESICADSGLTVDMAVKGIKSMNEVPNLKGLFEGLFEQVLAAVDFGIFYRLMCRTNIIIQEQVLKIILKQTGHLSSSLTRDEEEPKHKTSGSQRKSKEEEEEEMLQRAIEASKREEEVKKIKNKEQDSELQKTLLLSQQEAKVLSSEKKSLDEDIKRLTLLETQAADASKTHTAAAAATTAAPIVKPPLASGIQSKVSSSQAANDWLKSAKSEAMTSPAYVAAKAQMAELSSEDLKQRQEHLKAQRDKLLAMKKQEREKQLLTAAKSNPKRPQSARAARAAMEQKVQAPTHSEEDERKMAMRRAIADKLKMEVIGQH